MTFLEVTDIQNGCTHDGPGLRTTVFLKGCPLHCKWCHNPETQSRDPEFFYRPERCIACGKCAAVCPKGCHEMQEGFHEFDPTACIRCMKCTQACPAKALEQVSSTMSVEEIMEKVRQDKVFYRHRGGLTISGGEPTFQKGFLELLQMAKAEGIGTAVETCGAFPAALVPELLACTDWFLYDLKDTAAARLKENTGADLEQILRNLHAIDAGGGKTVLRCVLIPEVNLNEAHANAVAEVFASLQNCQCVELLPYHPYGLSKSEQLGKEGTRYRQPEPEEIQAFAAILRQKNIPVKLYGSMME